MGQAGLNVNSTAGHSANAGLCCAAAAADDGADGGGAKEVVGVNDFLFSTKLDNINLLKLSAYGRLARHPSYKSRAPVA